MSRPLTSCIELTSKLGPEELVTMAPEPLLHAAIAIVLLSPQIPLLFMGEEWGSRRPFPFFCDFAPPLDEAVREGRRREFAHYPAFADPEAQARTRDALGELSGYGRQLRTALLRQTVRRSLMG